MPKNTLLIGIAGASGSGKTSIALSLRQMLGKERVTLLHHDNYYIDLSGLPPHEREEINFDHPDSIESSLLVEHLDSLKQGNRVETPCYDFSTHTRKSKGAIVEPAGVIIVEGILVLAVPELRKQFDIKIFVEAEDDICFIRRAKRDMNERNRSFDSAVSQYLTSVKPMQQMFVQPSKQYADVIILQQHNKAALQLIAAAVG